jgi:hypothetical protein
MPVPANRRLRFDMPLPETVRSPRVEVLVVISDEPAASCADACADACAADAADDDVDAENGLAATLAACQEARDIMSGKIPSKGYTDVDEFFADLYAEIEAEEAAERSESCVTCP